MLVEVEKPKPEARLDKESRSTVTSLAAHPGWQILMERLRAQRALLTTKLTRERQDSLESVHFLQAGVYWSGWLEEQLSREVYKQERPQPKPVDDDLHKIFESLRANIEGVGLQEDATSIKS